jgi:hypothetical protein
LQVSVDLENAKAKEKGHRKFASFSGQPTLAEKWDKDSSPLGEGEPSKDNRDSLRSREVPPNGSEKQDDSHTHQSNRQEN